MSAKTVAAIVPTSSKEFVVRNTLLHPKLDLVRELLRCLAFQALRMDDIGPKVPISFPSDTISMDGGDQPWQFRGINF